MGLPDVVVIGAGVVGAACALAAARTGLSVTVVDRGPVAGGSTSAGEGNLLVSDKAPGPELDLAVHSLRHWYEVADHVGDLLDVTAGGFELDPKGGLTVAVDEPALTGLAAFADSQRAAGIDARPVPAADLPDHEPNLARDLAGGTYYPQDSQVQPVLAAARMLAAARRHGVQVRTGCAVIGMLRAGERVTGVRTADGALAAGAVVNAAGTWGGRIAALAGVHVPVLPRRGIVLVTAPVPVLVRHKVYAADYVAGVASDAAALQTATVVEGTAAGTILIGASRERVGFDPATPVAVIRRLAEQAVRLFPLLAEVSLLRTYRGFRPYCPDHLPVIGADSRAPGLLHACGHEGAGIGLAAGTGHLLAQLLADVPPDLDLTPFRPERFGAR